jgi:Cation/multidrug efflux pump
LAGEAIEIMRRNPKVAYARNEWGNMSKVMRPGYDPVKAGALGFTKSQIMESVKSIRDGNTVGVIAMMRKRFPVLLKSDGLTLPMHDPKVIHCMER